jgi:endonuclease/exonuclease/phosphatase family metal-dependent hydrolase
MRCLRVATLNIWNRGGPWERRCELIRRELQGLEPDLVGLQEVLRLKGATFRADQSLELAAGLGFHVAYGPADDLGGGLTLGNALLSRHPILEHEAVPLPAEGSGESRSLLYARVDTPFGEAPIFVTHLNWKLHHGRVRLRQVQGLVDEVRRLAPPQNANAFPAIVMGDFNAEPDSDEMRFLRGLATLNGKSVYFADAWLWAGDGGAGATFDRRNPYAALAHEPPRRIDYILVRGPDARFRGEPVSARLAFDRPETTDDAEVWPSDHFGLVSDLAADPRPRG